MTDEVGFAGGSSLEGVGFDTSAPRLPASPATLTKSFRYRSIGTVVSQVSVLPGWARTMRPRMTACGLQREAEAGNTGRKHNEHVAKR